MYKDYPNPNPDPNPDPNPYPKPKPNPNPNPSPYPNPNPNPNSHYQYSLGMETPRQLVGRQVLRNFGKQGIHKGTITSFDDDGELTFRVEYEDGDAEDLSQGDARDTLIDKGIVRVASRSRRDKEMYTNMTGSRGEELNLDNMQQE